MNKIIKRYLRRLAFKLCPELKNEINKLHSELSDAKNSMFVVDTNFMKLHGKTPDWYNAIPKIESKDFKMPYSFFW